MITSGNEIIFFSNIFMILDVVLKVFALYILYLSNKALKLYIKNNK